MAMLRKESDTKSIYANVIAIVFIEYRRPFIEGCSGKRGAGELRNLGGRVLIAYPARVGMWSYQRLFRAGSRG